jgi:hypothetical protein
MPHPAVHRASRPACPHDEDLLPGCTRTRALALECGTLVCALGDRHVKLTFVPCLLPFGPLVRLVKLTGRLTPSLSPDLWRGQLGQPILPLFALVLAGCRQLGLGLGLVLALVGFRCLALAGLRRLSLRPLCVVLGLMHRDSLWELHDCLVSCGEHITIVEVLAGG